MSLSALPPSPLHRAGRRSALTRATPAPVAWSSLDPSRARPAPIPANVSARFSEIKAEYAAALPSRFRRTRGYLGGIADSHYVNTFQFWSIREYARDMDRNDAIVGQLVDRAVGQIVGTGYRLTPKTGDPQLDGRLLEKWKRWSENPFACDAAKSLSFPEMEALVLRQQFVDGDTFALPLETGALQLVEGDHVDSPQKMGGDVIHGVRIDEKGAPVEFWFVRQRQWVRFAHVVLYAGQDGYDTRPAFDEDGEPVVIHVYRKTRATQSRGITVFAPIFDYLGMVEDTNFATLVKQQMASMLMGFLERQGFQQDFALGSRTLDSQADGTNQTLEEIVPGTLMRGRVGEKLTPFTPSIPGSEFWQHMKFLLRVIGAPLGLPLSLVLLDSSDGNFSSQRVELEEARLGFALTQVNYQRRFHRPVYRWKAREWLKEEGLDAREHPEILDHTWKGQGWSYIDPLTDAQADKLRLDNLFTSPRRLAAEHGEDWEHVVEETIEDRASAIEAAMKRAAELSTRDEPVTWRDVLNLSTPAGVTQTTTSNPGQERLQEEEAKRAKEEDVKRAEIERLVEARVEAKRAAMEQLVEARLRPIQAALEGIAKGLTAPPAPPSPAMQFNGEAHIHASGAEIKLPDSASATIAAELKQPNIEKIIVEVAEGAVQSHHHVESHNHNTFAPTVQAGEVTVENKIDVEVEAKMPPRLPRSSRITHADGSESIIVTE